MYKPSGPSSNQWRTSSKNESAEDKGPTKKYKSMRVNKGNEDEKGNKC
jgi:hypothetical protein